MHHTQSYVQQLTVYLVFCILDLKLINYFFFSSNLRVILGLLGLRAPKGLQGSQVIWASRDQRGRKVTVAAVVS